MNMIPWINVIFEMKIVNVFRQIRKIPRVAVKIGSRRIVSKFFLNGMLHRKVVLSDNLWLPLEAFKCTQLKFHTLALMIQNHTALRIEHSSMNMFNIVF